MANKTIKTRIQHKHAVETDWIKAVNFIPLSGELIIYDPDENNSIPRIKFGDGATNINNLPFLKGVGLETPKGGEIFNDYENNQALAEQASARGAKTAALGIAASAEGGAIRGTKVSNLLPNISVSISAISGNTITAKSTLLGNVLDGIDENTGFVIRVGTDIYIPIKTCDISGLLNNTIKLTAYAETVDISLIGQNITEVYIGMAYGDYSHVEGRNNMSIGEGSHAEGLLNTSLGNYSHTEGFLNIASGEYSHSEGIRNETIGVNSHSEGSYNISRGVNSHTEGYDNEAIGEHAHAEGGKTIAQGDVSHSEGVGTIATGYAQHVQGKFNEANANLAHIVGGGNTDTDRKNIHTVDWKGTGWFAGDVNADGTISANNIEATNTLKADNIQTSTIGDLNADISNLQNKTQYINSNAGTEAMAIGTNTASGKGSLAHGGNNAATGENSHAEGFNSKAIGSRSHAEGYSTANANYAHSEGYGTVAAGSYQHVSGVWNIEDANPEGKDRGIYAEIVGNGGKDNPSNARTLDWNGNAWFAGEVKVGGIGQNDSNAKTLLTEDKFDERFNTVLPYFVTRPEIYPNGEMSVFLNTCAEHTNGYGTIDNQTIYGDCKFSVSGQVSSQSTNVKIDILGPIKFKVNTIGEGIIRITIDGTSYEITNEPFEFEGNVKESFYVNGPYGTDLYFEYFVIDNKKLFFGDNIVNGEGLNNIQQDWENNGDNAPTFGGNNSILDAWAKEGLSNGDDTNKIKIDDNGKIIAGFGDNASNAIMLNGKSQAAGGKTFVAGSKNVALGNNAAAFGNATFAGGQHSFATGNASSATGNASFVAGTGNISSGQSSIAGGMSSTASGDYSIALGQGNEATAPNSAAIGQSNHALGENSYVIGRDNTALGINSYAEGIYNQANANYSHVEGYSNSTDAEYSHIEGYNNSNAGGISHIEGQNNSNSGKISHIEGSSNIISSDNSHAEGFNNNTYGVTSHVEGHSNVINTSADFSHAEGFSNEVYGQVSHVEGGKNVAKGVYNHVNGYGNISSGAYQTVIGKANSEDSGKVFIIGNGVVNEDGTITDSNRKNIFSVDWDGTIWNRGNIITKGTIITKNHTDIDSIITSLLQRVESLEQQLKNLQ